MHISSLTIFAILALHVFGDYCSQTNFMAQEKTKRIGPAILHGVIYTIPFLLITRNPWTLLIIAGTHVVIDRWRLPRYFIWFKNQFAPKAHRYPWSSPKLRAKKIVSTDIQTADIRTGAIGLNTLDAGKVSVGTISADRIAIGSFGVDNRLKNNPATGYSRDTPDWLAFWLLIIVDNFAHILIAVGAVAWLG